MPWGTSDWETIGIDGSRYLTVIRRKGVRSIKALNTRSRLLSYLKEQYALSANSPLRDFYNRYPEEFKIAYVLSKNLRKFHKDMVQKFYNDKIHGNNEDTLVMLYELYCEDPSYIKDIIFSMYLESKSLKTSNILTNDFAGFNLADINEEFCDRVARSVFPSHGRSKTTNVWHILKDSGSVTIFVFKKANSRARLPRVSKKGYHFLDYSKPIILQFSDRGRKLGAYSSYRTKEPQKLARQILRELTGDGVNLDYELEIVPSPNNKVNEFIEKVLRADFDNLHHMSLKQMEFYAIGTQNRTRIIAEKYGTDPYLYILNELKTNMHTVFNLHTVQSLILSNNGKDYSIQINLVEGDTILTYSARDDIQNKRNFENYMSTTFELKMNRNKL